MSSSSSRPVRANFLNLLSAILIFLVPSSTESSRFLYCRSSHTFFAFFFFPFPWPPGPSLPSLSASPLSPSSPSLPSSASFASASSFAFLKASISFSRPPSPSICSRSSLLKDFSNSRRSHSSGISDSSKPCRSSSPLK